MEIKETKLNSKCDNLPISVMTFIPEEDYKRNVKWLNRKNLYQ